MQVSEFCFPQKYKLKSSDDFRKVFAFRLKFSNAHLALYAMPNGFSFNRLGVAVGKINGNAVEAGIRVNVRVRVRVGA